MDSVYASPEDFKSMKHRDKAKGLHLLEYFVNKCHEIGVFSFTYIHTYAYAGLHLQNLVKKHLTKKFQLVASGICLKLQYFILYKMDFLVYIVYVCVLEDCV